MIGLLRFWLPVIPVAMAVLVLLSWAPDLGPCAGGEMQLFSLNILCHAPGPSAIVIGPVDIVSGAPVASALDPWIAAVFVAVAAIVAIVGAHRLRGLER